MNFKQRIELLEQDLVELRLKWKEASPVMKKFLEDKAKAKIQEISIIEKVLEKRAKIQEKLIP